MTQAKTPEEMALELFPVELRECGDGRDKNFVNRQCFLAGYRSRDTELAKLKAALGAIQAKVNEQALDDGLWSVPAEGTQRIAEAYLQQELRALHAMIEEVLR